MRIVLPSLGLLVVLLAGGVPAPAHEPPKTVTRELVRLQGFRRSGGDAPAGRMTLRAQGVEQPFAATDRRVFVLTGDGAEAPKLPDDAALQGPREVIARFAGARADQVVTILAERRPGGSDLFVLALDLCPAK